MKCRTNKTFVAGYQFDIGRSLARASRSGLSLFKEALSVDGGTTQILPTSMKKLCRSVHDVLDRDDPRIR